ncbi:hypothetical protein C3B55_00600 [Candidatus Pseudomonas adelgestsugas]|uniref:Uncharacterized protein n=1 Tax=Candidatus Pseudomonas adelgestsugas TaxID=1302376 RepID=A0ABX5R8H5_9PSED|nr:hypothetical protein C3B55_00600 [Candidatus Pseudomonas adelgestsugas]
MIVIYSKPDPLPLLNECGGLLANYSNSCLRNFNNSLLDASVMMWIKQSSYFLVETQLIGVVLKEFQFIT